MPISLKTLIDRREVNTRVMALLQQRAVAAIYEVREKGETGTLDERSFVFSDDFRTMEIYPVGDTSADERQIVAAFGEVLMNAVIASPNHPKRLIKIARDCTNGEIRDLDLRMERRLSDTIYIPLIAIILTLLLLLFYLSH
ncbi:MAG: hypothetical protein MJZ63_03285 [Muribaculaceae bacterium]|nr:hypothetical protein [Muribaculaceae bacterium]